MFLLTREGSLGRRAAEVLGARFPVPLGELHEVAVGAHTLYWASGRVRENLHVFDDGVLIGKIASSEECVAAPIVHDTSLPARTRPLEFGTIVRRGRSGPTVEPLGTTNVFHAGTSVSDHQLLLAIEGGWQPSPQGVAALMNLGYLPANTTLFAEVERIAFLHRWEPDRGAATACRELDVRAPDDDAMLERLISIVPRDRLHSVGLSGGFDSRFVLGVLLAADADVRIVRFQDPETAVVEAIAAELDLEVVAAGVTSDLEGRRTAAEFTLLSDAQFRFGANQHGRLASCVGPEEYYDTGHFQQLLKNADKTAWKKPDPRRPFWDRLVDEAMLSATPAVQPRLRSCATREEFREHIIEAVSFQREYVDFPKRKQWSGWFNYMNRGLRWSQAFYEDLTYFSNPLYVMSDIDAMLLGNAAGFWSGFANDRPKALIHRLLPSVDVEYFGGASVLPSKGPIAAARKIEYEYLGRLKVRNKNLARAATNRTTHESNLPDSEPSAWQSYFTAPMEEVATGAGGMPVRRASVTVAHVLALLEAAAVEMSISP